MSEESALTFPCEFPIKVMGINSDSFENEVFMIANQHIPNIGENAIRSTPSRTEKYLSVTVTITAQNREQLDTLYRAFSKHPDVKMVL
jgi:hypothetical protein